MNCYLLFKQQFDIIKIKLSTYIFLFKKFVDCDFNLIWFISYIDLTSIWDWFMWKNYRNYQRIEQKKILKPSPKMKNLFRKQRQRGVTTSFHHFNTNESYNPCPHKKKKQNEIKKTKSNSSTLNFHSSTLCFHETILNRLHMNLCIV